MELAAVIGAPDEKSGESVKAFIQLKPGETATEEEIIEFSKENMAGYKRPKHVEFRDSLPVSPVGKVLRRVLRDEKIEKDEKEYKFENPQYYSNKPLSELKGVILLAPVGEAQKIASSNVFIGTVEDMVGTWFPQVGETRLHTCDRSSGNSVLI